MRVSTYGYATAVLVLLFWFCSGCSLKPNEAIREADNALAEAEAAGAPEKTPEIYEQAREHYEQGERQVVYFRYSRARCKYKASAREARLAKEYARKDKKGAPTPTECPPCPEPEAEDCCIELDLCLSDNKDLEEKLEKCRNRKVVYRTRTKVVREPCAEPSRPEAPARENKDPTEQVLIGTFTVTGPPAMQTGSTTYQVTVRYSNAHLGEAPSSLENNYSVLVDVVSVDPPDAQAMSSMMGYAPLQDGGQWPLTVFTPGNIKGPVRVGVGITLKSKRTGEQFNLAPIEVTIPAARRPEKGPEIRTEPAKQPPPKEIMKQQAGASWVLCAGMTVAGLIIGLAIGVLLFRGRSRSTLGS